MNTKTLASLMTTGFLLVGVGTAHAADFHSASTPEQTPMVTTPFVATPAIGTPLITTPSEKADVDVEPVELPTGAEVRLGGLVEQSVSTPEATPALSVAPEVPSLDVAPVEVASIEVEEIPVQVDMPAAATAGTDGSHAWTAGLPVEGDASQDGNDVTAHVGGINASIGIDA